MNDTTEVSQPEANTVPPAALIQFRCSCQDHPECASPPVTVEILTAGFLAENGEYRRRHRVDFLRVMADAYDNKVEEIRVALNNLDPTADRPPASRDIIIAVDPNMMAAPVPVAQQGEEHDH